MTAIAGGAAYTGKAATESLVLRHGSEAGVLYLAAHGTFNQRNPLFSALYLAPGEGEDGRLDAYEIYRLDMPALIAPNCGDKFFIGTHYRDILVRPAALIHVADELMLPPADWSGALPGRYLANCSPIQRSIARQKHQLILSATLVPSG